MTKKLWGKLDLDGKAQWRWSFYNPETDFKNAEKNLANLVCEEMLDLYE
jgi:hypothetical protein